MLSLVNLWFTYVEHRHKKVKLRSPTTWRRGYMLISVSTPRQHTARALTGGRRGAASKIKWTIGNNEMCWLCVITVTIGRR